MDPVNTEIDSKYHFGYVDIILYTIICIVTIWMLSIDINLLLDYIRN